MQSVALRVAARVTVRVEDEKTFRRRTAFEPTRPRFTGGALLLVPGAQQENQPLGNSSPKKVTRNSQTSVFGFIGTISKLSDGFQIAVFTNRCKRIS
jgi:hypothetical protein